jgi:hypothetical protein
MVTENKPAIAITTDVMDVAIININPGSDLAIVNLRAEIIKLSNYATFRVIKCDLDLTPAGDDLVLVSKLKRALKEKQDEYVSPIKAHLEKVQFVFKDLLACLDDVDKTNRDKVLAYTAAQKKRAAEAEELNRQAIELARKQAEFSGTGEFTVDTTPVVAPAPVKKVATMSGTASTQVNWKYEVVDPALVPIDYMVIDYAKLTKVIKAGCRSIPGVRIYSEDSLRITTK